MNGGNKPKTCPKIGVDKVQQHMLLRREEKKEKEEKRRGRVSRRRVTINNYLRPPKLLCVCVCVYVWGGGGVASKERGERGVERRVAGGGKWRRELGVREMASQEGRD